MRKGLLILLMTTAAAAIAQTGDTTRVLEPVVIHAYSTNQPLHQLAASVAVVNPDELRRFSNTSLLPAVNTIPGVRMEERSPGSVRFSIRGSLLRSPFGVRNVKIYWNGLPLTDGGGNTYLNLLDFDAIGQVEVIKGPAGSLYGAGTGGVILLNSPLVKSDNTVLSTTFGSFGLRRLAVSHQIHGEKLVLRLHAAAHHSDGYREQTEMDRYAFHADLLMPVGEKGVFSASLFYTDLNYETPGGLTQQQYDENPRQARPAAGPNRGAVEQKAAVYNKTPYFSVNYNQETDKGGSTSVGIFWSLPQFRNPTVRNYEERRENNLGLRAQKQRAFGSDNQHQLSAGVEAQYFKGPLTVYDNEYGSRAAVQTDDELSSQLGSAFAQAHFEIFNEAFLTIGGSLNTTMYRFSRHFPTPSVSHTKRFNLFLAPRIAVVKNFKGMSVFANISRGFSPPSLAEVRPSTNAFNNDLQAERGTSYEIGLRANTPDGRFSGEIVAYDFSLREAIVVQHLPDGADYFVNAGQTSQRGVEATASWTPFQRGDGVFTDAKIWTSYAYNDYRFTRYAIDEIDYSGNKLTGVPASVSTTGVDIATKNFYLNATANYVSEIPLNDGNTVFASAYFLLGARVGHRRMLNEHKLDLFMGIDNATNQKYSLGNDLNAVFGGRYFNPAPPRNFYAGLTINIHR